MARKYTTSVSQITTPTPYVPREWLNAGETYAPVTETITIAQDPGGRYRIELDHNVDVSQPMTVTANSAARAIIPYGTAPAVGQCAVRAVENAPPLVEFNAADNGRTASVTYTPLASPITSGRMCQLEKQLMLANHIQNTDTGTSQQGFDINTALDGGNPYLRLWDAAENAYDLVYNVSTGRWQLSQALQASAFIGDGAGLTNLALANIAGYSTAKNVLISSGSAWTSRALTTADISNGFQLLYINTTGSSAIANTAQETAFDISYTLPANCLEVGHVFRLTLWGIWSSDANNAGGNLTIKPKWNGATLSSEQAYIFTAGTGISNYYFEVEQLVCVRAVGASGSLQGRRRCSNRNDYTHTATVVSPPYARDTSGTIPITVTAQFASALAGNTVSLTYMTVEKIAGKSI